MGEVPLTSYQIREASVAYVTHAAFLEMLNLSFFLSADQTNYNTLPEMRRSGPKLVAFTCSLDKPQSPSATLRPPAFSFPRRTPPSILAYKAPRVTKVPLYTALASRGLVSTSRTISQTYDSLGLSLIALQWYTTLCQLLSDLEAWLSIIYYLSCFRVSFPSFPSISIYYCFLRVLRDDWVAHFLSLIICPLS